MKEHHPADELDESDKEYLREILGAAACSLDRERTDIIDREFSTYRGNPNLPFDEEDHFPD
jgi:hypothetical protein